MRYHFGALPDIHTESQMEIHLDGVVYCHCDRGTHICPDKWPLNLFPSAGREQLNSMDCAADKEPDDAIANMPQLEFLHISLGCLP